MPEKITVPETPEPNLFSDMPTAEDVQEIRDNVLFAAGKWMPCHDPLLIGKENFSDIKNLRYKDTYLEGVCGYSKINDTPIADYPYGRNGIQLRAPYITSSIIAVQQSTFPDIIANNLAGTVDILEDCTLSGAPRVMKANDLYFKVYPTRAGSDPLLYEPLNFKTYDDATIYGQPYVLCFNHGNRIFILKGYTTVSAEANGTIDPAGSGFNKMQDMQITGTPVVFCIKSGGEYYYFKAYERTLATAVLQNTTRIPDLGDFEEEILHIDDTNAGLGRFAAWPQGHLAYCNGVETMIWAGGEMPCAAFIASTAAITSTTTNPKDFTEQMRNTLMSADQVVTIDTTYKYGLIGSLRPLKGITFYLTEFNDPGATFTWKEHKGDDWHDLTVVDGTDGLSKNGKVTFSSTVSTSKPRYFEGRVLYWYQYTLSAGSAKVYHVSLDAPFQPINDLWDGMPRIALNFVVNKGTPVDYALYVADETEVGMIETPVCADLSALTTSQYVDCDFEEPTCGFLVTMFEQVSGKVNTNAATMTVSYWNGSSFTAVTGLVDGTSNTAGTVSFNRSGVVFFDPPAPGAEFPINELGMIKYRYRLTWSATLSGTVLVDVFQGINAPRKISGGYKFPAMFQNRPLLCGYIAGKEGNRVDYGMSDAVSVWNGESASFAGAALYFGGSEELTAFAQVYNRFGASIYIAGIFTKNAETYVLLGSDPDTYKIYQLSDSVGCPAPLTMDTITLVSQPGSETDRNVAVWLSYKGPVLCDAAGMALIAQDIECYFDREDERCVNYDAIKKCIGWFDQDNVEYNLIIPSGVGVQSLNVWLCYDYRRKKWFQKQPEGAFNPYPQSRIKVIDDSGVQHVYGMLDDGYMVRLEHGPRWIDEEIRQEVTTGEFNPTGNTWDMFRLRRLKTMAAALTEETELTITHYADGNDTGISLQSHDLSGPARHTRKNQSPNILAWSHKLKFSAATNSESRGIKLIGWGYMGEIEREDLN